MHHTRSSSFGGIVGVICAKSAQVTSLRRDDRGRAVTLSQGCATAALSGRAPQVMSAGYSHSGVVVSLQFLFGEGLKLKDILSTNPDGTTNNCSARPGEFDNRTVFVLSSFIAVSCSIARRSLVNTDSWLAVTSIMVMTSYTYNVYC